MSDPVSTLNFLHRNLEKCYVDGCAETTFRKCILCKRPTCPDHLSKEDDDYCAECFAPENTELRSEPLVDVDGVNKTGRHLVPVGNYYLTFPTLVTRMSREKLEACVQEMAQEVAICQQQLDKASVRLSIAKCEMMERIENEPKKLRGQGVGLRITDPATGVTKRISGSTMAAKGANLLTQFQKLGVTPEQLLKMITDVMMKKGGKK